MTSIALNKLYLEDSITHKTWNLKQKHLDATLNGYRNLISYFHNIKIPKLMLNDLKIRL